MCIFFTLNVFSCTTAQSPMAEAPAVGSTVEIVEVDPVETTEIPGNDPVPALPTDGEPVAEPVAEPIEDTPFDPNSISVELKEITFFDVKAFIGKLNSIIQAKNYEEWLAELTQEYRDYYSSAETLARISEAAVLKRQKIVLNSLYDYFIHVVYPSRQKDRVDDIEFIDESRIRAITLNVKGERLVLYNLEKIDDIWKIAIWR